MQDEEKPRISYQSKPTMGQQMGRGTRNSAEGLGYLIAVAVPWIARDFVPYPVPEEVLSAFSGWALSVAVRAKERLF